MNILLGFAPFLAFAIIERLVGVQAGLLAGALVSAGLLIRDVLINKRGIKILEIGTLILFVGLALYAMLRGAQWSMAAVRLRVDAGLLLIVLISLAIGKPFTLQYAREQVSRELWDSPAFMHVNIVITAAWALAFVVMVAADVLLTYAPTVPRSVGIITTVAALVAAVKFTGWYPSHRRKMLGDARG
ncbi:MAG: hypothetical protein ACRYG5_20085 [Janthinobacterium lividum]